MAVTIKDVAARAGVSPSTVSRTCKDSPTISKETKEKVRRAMAELGYEPGAVPPAQDAFAKTIGIVLPPSQEDTYRNPFFLEVIRGISSFCTERRYINTILTGEDEAEILETVQSMRENGQADAFILLFSRQDDPIEAYLHSEGVLYVMIGKAGSHPREAVCVDNDNLMAAKEAAEYLIGLGHRRIAYLGSSNRMFFAADRKSGYQLALMQAGLPLQPEYCVELPDMAGAGEQMEALLRRPDRPTAVLVSDDILAVALKLSCVRLGLAIPQQLSILAFNNSLFAQLSAPPLTSIDVNALQLGIEAASQAINHIENPSLRAAKIIVPHHLLVRSSCAAPQP